MDQEYPMEHGLIEQARGDQNIPNWGVRTNVRFFRGDQSVYGGLSTACPIIIDGLVTSLLARISRSDLPSSPVSGVRNGGKT